MTEPPFTFDSAEQPDALTADEPEKNNRRTVVALGALGAVVLAAGAFLFLGSGGEESAELALTPVKPSPRVEEPATADEQAATLPAASDVKLGHNPFEVLYAEPAAAAEETAPAPQAAALVPASAPVPVIVVANAAPVAPAPAAVSPVRPAPTAPAATPATTKPAPAPAPVPVRSTVKLTNVSTAEGSPPVGTFVLDGKEQQGAKGAVFDGKLIVVDLLQNTDGAWYAILQVGDGSPFEVHKNQEVVVQ